MTKVFYNGNRSTGNSNASVPFLQFVKKEAGRQILLLPILTTSMLSKVLEEAPCESLLIEGQRKGQ